MEKRAENGWRLLIGSIRLQEDFIGKERKNKEMNLSFAKEAFQQKSSSDF